jgi:hypothetical protein
MVARRRSDELPDRLGFLLQEQQQPSLPPAPTVEERMVPMKGTWHFNREINRCELIQEEDKKEEEEPTEEEEEQEGPRYDHE